MKLDIASLKNSSTHAARLARKHTVAIFLLFFLAIYGFLGARIITLNQVQPDQSSVADKLKTAGVPNIDQGVLNKIQQLQDNSVNVQTLFDNARSSPFQE